MTFEKVAPGIWALRVYDGSVTIAKLYEEQGEWFYRMTKLNDRRFYPLLADSFEEAKEKFLERVHEELTDEQNWCKELLDKMKELEK